MNSHALTAEEADIILLLEGSYPYVHGGVSSWVHTIIKGFPQHRFAAIFVGGQESDYDEIKYDLPSNLVHLETHYLFSGHQAKPPKPCTGNREAIALVEEMHEWFKAYPNNPFNKQFCNLKLFDSQCGIDFEQFLYSESAWDFLTEQFETHCTDTSFIDYFWTIRQIHHPIWTLANIAKNTPKGKIYHSISTGYAGYLGALLHYNHPDTPLILTEHGLYTKERRIDLLRAEWETHEHYALHTDITEDNYFRSLWERYFESLGRICYEAATPIVSLFNATNDYQITHGAQPERTMIIPNGTSLKDMEILKQQRPKTIPPIIGLIGRVVPIKDIKTYIHASSHLKKQIPELQAWIIGPTEEDPEYLATCEKLVENIGAEDYVKFLGTQDVHDIFPKLGLMVLSSISEGLPLVVIESFAAALPVVATDVGACRELIFGKDEDDKQFGAAGDIVDIANPRELANACYRLLTDEQAWLKAQQAAVLRVKKYYDLEQMFTAYHKIYEEAMTWPELALN